MYYLSNKDEEDRDSVMWETDDEDDLKKNDDQSNEPTFIDTQRRIHILEGEEHDNLLGQILESQHCQEQNLERFLRQILESQRRQEENSKQFLRCNTYQKEKSKELLQCYKEQEKNSEEMLKSVNEILKLQRQTPQYPKPFLRSENESGEQKKKVQSNDTSV